MSVRSRLNGHHTTVNKTNLTTKLKKYEVNRKKNNHSVTDYTLSLNNIKSGTFNFTRERICQFESKMAPRVRSVRQPGSL